MRQLYAGIDLHSNNNHIGILDKEYTRIYHRRLPNRRDVILAELEPCSPTSNFHLPGYPISHFLTLIHISLEAFLRSTYNFVALGLIVFYGSGVPSIKKSDIGLPKFIILVLAILQFSCFISASASLLSSANPLSLFVASPFAVIRVKSVEIACRHTATVILWHLSKISQSKHLCGGSPWSMFSACCPKHSLESHSFFI